MGEDKRILQIGIGVLVAGMIMIGLGMYFETSATVVLVLFGGLVTILGLMALGVGGALRLVGALLLVVGIIGSVFGVVGTSALLPGIFVGNYLYYILPTGIWWGPFMIAIGLISLVVARQSRGAPLPA